jgi:hypothetical protein
MAGIQQAGDVNAALCSVAEQAREAWSRFANEVELERRMQESPMQILGVAAVARFRARRGSVARAPSLREGDGEDRALYRELARHRRRGRGDAGRERGGRRADATR